mgnify:CR=1 FL=1
MFHLLIPKDSASTIEKAIHKIRYEKLEHLYVFRNGKQVQHYVGTFGNVNPDPANFICHNQDTWVHNHPSGDPTPSSADIEMTKLIAETARPLKIRLHDHLIIGKSRELSFREAGYI